MPGWPSGAGILAAILLSVTAPGSPAIAAQDRVATALAAREQGNYALAIKLLREAAADTPTDADVLRQLGTTLAFAHRYPEAIAVLEHARALAPRDEDIALALARTLLWSGKIAAARHVVAEAAIIDPANADVRDVTASIAAAAHDAPHPSFDVAETVSGVSIGTNHLTWSETAATLGVPLDPHMTLVAGVDREDRSTAIDTRLSLRADRRFAWGSAYVGAAATPAATFRERWSVVTGGAVPIKPFLLGSIDVRRAHYDLVDVTAIELGATIHSPTDRWAATVHSVNLWGEGGRYHSGWSLRGDYTPSSAVRLFGGAATYSDTEAGVTRQVDSGFVGGAYQVSTHLSVQVAADHEVRHASYRRNGVTVGVHWRFGR